MCDNATRNKMKKLPSTLTTMPPKTTAERIAEMKVQQAQLDKELAQAEEDVACEERQCAEEVAVKEKKECEEHEKHDVEHKQEERELVAAKARMAKYEAEAKARAEAGKLTGGSNASSDTEVMIMGVTTKVSDCVVVENFSKLGE